MVRGSPLTILKVFEKSNFKLSVILSILRNGRYDFNNIINKLTYALPNFAEPRRDALVILLSIPNNYTNVRLGDDYGD